MQIYNKFIKLLLIYFNKKKNSNLIISNYCSHHGCYRCYYQQCFGKVFSSTFKCKMMRPCGPVNVSSATILMIKFWILLWYYKIKFQKLCLLIFQLFLIQSCTLQIWVWELLAACQKYGSLISWKNQAVKEERDLW